MRKFVWNLKITRNYEGSFFTRKFVITISKYSQLQTYEYLWPKKFNMHITAVLRIRIRNRIRIQIPRIHVFLGLLDPDTDPLVRGMDRDPDPNLDPSNIKQK